MYYKLNLINSHLFTDYLIKIYFNQIKNKNTLKSNVLTNPNISYKHINEILKDGKEIVNYIAYNKNPKIIMKYFNRFSEFHKETTFKRNKFSYKFYKFVWNNCNKNIKEAMLNSKNISKKFVLEHKDEFREYNIDIGLSILKMLDYN